MSYGLTLKTPPGGEPISVAEAKLFARIDLADDDNLVAGLITAARRLCEVHTGRQLVSATWRHTLDYFPGYLSGSPSTYMAWREWPAFGDVIRLPMPPLQSVVSLTYLDTTGTLQTLSPALYQVDADQEPARIRPAYGQVWPVARAQLSTVNTIYQAGYGPVTSIAEATTPGVQTVTPATMSGIYVGTLLDVDLGQKRETVAVTAVSPTLAPTQFTASFAGTHAPGVYMGPGLSAQRPLTLKALLMMVAYWYEHREAAGPGTLSELPLGVRALLDAEWYGEYA